MAVRLVPVSLATARAFVVEHHRHSRPPRGWLFGVGLDVDGQLVAVGAAGRPNARALQDGVTVEITRVAVGSGLGTSANAASRVYGALCRAAVALGYWRAITYNLRSESGVSLRAAGFTLVAELEPRDSWASSGRGRYDSTVWGEPTLPNEPRNRWERILAAPRAAAGPMPPGSDDE